MVAQADTKTPSRRIFVAVLPDAATRAELVRRQKLLLPHLAKARATAADNLHLTLAFLGMLEEGQVASTLEAMREAAASAPAEDIDLPLGGLGSFGREGRAILWQGIALGPGRDALVKLQANLDAALRSHGFELDDRPYRPHITLARNVRLGKAHAPLSLDDYLAGGGARLVGATPAQGNGASDDRVPHLRASALSLMWSHHPRGGRLTYTELERVPLG
jgi:2'-5' RNA ligase